MEAFVVRNLSVRVCYCQKCRECHEKMIEDAETLELKLKAKRKYLEAETNILKMEWKQLKRDERRLQDLRFFSTRDKLNFDRFDQSDDANVPVDPIDDCPSRGFENNPLTIEEAEELQVVSDEDVAEMDGIDKNVDQNGTDDGADSQASN